MRLRRSKHGQPRVPIRLAFCDEWERKGAGHPRCGQLFVFRHSSAIRSRSTGRPPTRCSSTISAASSGLHVPVPNSLRINHHRGPVLALVQASGFVDPHLAPSPAALASCCNCVCRSLFPSAVQDGRGASSGTHIVADKNVAFKRRQAVFLLRKIRYFFQSRLNPTSPPVPRPQSLVPNFPQSPTPPARICENRCLTMSSDNLLSLKDDMVAFIEGHGLHRLPGYVTEDIPPFCGKARATPTPGKTLSRWPSTWALPSSPSAR
jgi:hypothetical protein